MFYYFDYFLIITFPLILKFFLFFDSFFVELMEVLGIFWFSSFEYLFEKIIALEISGKNNASSSSSSSSSITTLFLFLFTLDWDKEEEFELIIIASFSFSLISFLLYILLSFDDFCLFSFSSSDKISIMLLSLYNFIVYIFQQNERLIFYFIIL